MFHDVPRTQHHADGDELNRFEHSRKRTDDVGDGPPFLHSCVGTRVGTRVGTLTTLHVPTNGRLLAFAKGGSDGYAADERASLHTQSEPVAEKRGRQTRGNRAHLHQLLAAVLDGRSHRPAHQRRPERSHHGGDEQTQARGTDFIRG